MVNSGSQTMNKRRGVTLIELAVILVIIVILIFLLLPAMQQTRGPHPRARCRNSLKVITLALHQYADDFGTFPPAYTVDVDGNPLHSWRTLLLPYLDHRNLYESIDLSKPWNDPVNAEALKRIPDFYSCPLMTGEKYQTLFLGVTAKEGIFIGATPRKLKELIDKPEETLIVLEVDGDQGVPWMAPWDADEKMILQAVTKSEGPHPGGRNVAFVDVSVRTLPVETTAAELKRMMTIAGGD